MIMLIDHDPCVLRDIEGLLDENNLRFEEIQWAQNVKMTNREKDSNQKSKTRIAMKSMQSADDESDESSSIQMEPILKYQIFS